MTASLAFAFACGDDSVTPTGGGGQGSTGGANTGGESAGGGGACAEGIEVSATEILTLSVEELRTFFAVESGFDEGALYFADAASSLDQCPAYDQSAVLFVSPIDDALLPLELRGMGHLVKLVWGLNGLRQIVFGADERVERMINGYERFTPVEACTVLDADLDEAEKLAYVAGLEAAHPDTRVSHLTAIGVLCWGGFDVGAAPEDTNVDGDDAALRELVYAFADDVRGDAEIGIIEWSSYAWGFPSVFEIGSTIEGEAVYPECLRTATRELLDMGIDFASLPSFPQPLGQGWLPNNDACQ